MSATPKDLIAKRAYEIWEAEGCPHGREQEHWLRAEQEFSADGTGVVTQLRAAAAENRPARITQSQKRSNRR